MHRPTRKSLPSSQVQDAEFGLADAHGVLQHRVETGSSSPGELLMTFSTSAVAVCCSSDS